MSYRKLAKSMKGMNIKWSDKIFPDFRKVSGSKVSKKRIKRAAIIVVQILTDEQKRILEAFKTLAKKRHKDKKIIIDMDIKTAIERAKNTRLSKQNDDLYGETDGDRIWICANKMSEEELVSTILHECLHGITTFNDKEICEKDEHYVIRLLGDDI
jgi:hypothetical protein